jgi:outer membrane protein OmpA-like peptidoglycan-associated protein
MLGPCKLSIPMLLAGTLVTSGCAGRHVKAPDAPLGRVIIYRNGVAYFERRAMVEDELTLDVPADRVDDFLKSLTVVDAKTGESLPVSYQTARSGAMVEMTIELPKGKRDVRIAYVTESPAWKPSYRIMLGDHGDARLQSWAIVDNVSGETWKHVRVGVGSTSALSFRYDLHSVQLVERETIDSGVKLAAAPPQGGSPYAIGADNVRVLAEISGSQIEERDFAAVTAVSSGVSLAGTTSAEAKYEVEGASASRKSKRARSGTTSSAAVGREISMDEFRNIPVDGRSAEFNSVVESTATPGDPVAALVQQLSGNQQRVRIEGWAKPGEPDPEQAGLRRANTLRARLAARGIAEDRIEVAGQSQPTEGSNLVRVVAIEGANRPVQAREDDGDQPRGAAHFLADTPMTLAAGHSAMVTLFHAKTKAERVYLYDPVSDRGSKRFAFNAVRVVNPSDNTLDSGPITVYAKQQFLGEGLTEPIPPKASALVPYALDRSLVIDPKSETREEVELLQTIERGIATTQTQRIRRTELDIANRGHAEARLFVRHRVPTGWSLREPPKDIERMRGDVLVPVTIGAGEAKTIVLEEAMPITTAIDLRSAPGLRAIAVFLKAHTVAPELKRDLEAVLAAQRKLATLAETLTSRRAHADALRQRVNELSSQLVELRKVGRAQSLSGHLAKRMRTVGDQLDDVAAQVSDLEAQRLEAGIAFDDLIAELKLDAKS